MGIKHGMITNGEFNESAFFNELDEKIDLVIRQLLERLEIQAKKKVKNFPFLMGQGVWMGSDGMDYEETLEELKER